MTIDIDFLLQAIPNTPEALRPVLDEIIAVDTGNDFITFEVTKIMPIASAKKYAGIGATIVARIKNTRTVFSVDFGVGDVIVPRPEKRRIPSQLVGFESPVVSAYSVESAVAEKLDAILSLMEFSSRMKDYYDILYLSRKFDFDGTTLTEAIARTIDNRGRNFEATRFDLLMALAGDSVMEKKWTAFLRKIKTDEVDFPKMLSLLDQFLRAVVTAATSGRNLTKTWYSIEGQWR